MAKPPSLADSMRRNLVTPAPVHAAALTADVPAAAIEPTVPKTYHAATREGLKKVTAGLNPEDHKRFRLLSVNLGKTNEELLREAIDGLFAKYEGQ